MKLDDEIHCMYNAWKTFIPNLHDFKSNQQLQNKETERVGER